MDAKTVKAKRLLVAALVVLIAALTTGTAFAGWFNHSAEIFLTYTSAGLSWCL